MMGILWISVVKTSKPQKNKLIFGGLFFFCYFCGVNSGVPDALWCGLLVCIGGRG